jgi:predicted amidohydrolase
MRLALVSLDQVWQDKATNFSRCADYVGRALAHGCDLVIFPEMTLTGFSMNPVLAEVPSNSATLRDFGELARRYNRYILFGACLSDDQSGRPANALCIAKPSGEVEVPYTKMHLFSYAAEDQLMVAGGELAVVSVAGLEAICSICYDLRFPEPFSLAAPYSNAIVNIANWPARRVAHWRALLVARAIENQCYAIGVNRTGVDGNGLEYERSSLVASPDGMVLQPVAVDAEMDIYDVDPAEVERYRASFPTVHDKRYDLYRNLKAGVAS